MPGNPLMKMIAPLCEMCASSFLEMSLSWTFQMIAKPGKRLSSIILTTILLIPPQAIVYEWQFCSQLKIQAFQSVQDDYLAQHVDDPDALENTEKRIQYGKYLCTEEEWVFLYGKIGHNIHTLPFHKRTNHNENNRECWKTYIKMI
jgi:hypothetical protein